MELFIDTSNNYLIYALIENRRVIKFLKIETDKNTTKIAIFHLFNFLKKYNVEIKDLKKYYLTIGPGSFTGVKVSANIVRTIDLIYPIDELFVISSFDLLKDKNYPFVFIPFSKDKCYFRNYKFLKYSKIRIINQNCLSTNSFMKKGVYGYKYFNERVLEQKILKNKFKRIMTNQLKLIYIDNFKGKLTFYGN